MELEDLKNTWSDATSNLPKQPNLTEKMIDQMTQTRYNTSLKKIAYPEMAGVAVCFIGAAYIGVSFNKLDTVFLQSAGILSALLLVILPVLSLITIRRFNKIGDVNNTYSETLKKFALQKIRFQKFQKVSVVLCYLLLVTVIILLPKFFSQKDITVSKYFWIFSFSFGYIFLSFYSRWVHKYYGKSLRQAEELLKEL